MCLPRPRTPLLLVVAYDTNRVEDRHPLVLVRAETVGRGLASELALADLSVEGVRAFLLDRYGSVPGGRLAEWLHDRTDGNPRFLSQYLDRLEEVGILSREGEAWKLNGSTLSDSAATTLTSTGTYASTGSYSWDIVVADSASAAAIDNSINFTASSN